MNPIRSKKGEIATDTKEIQKIVRKYYEPIYANTLHNLDDVIDQSLGT